jgi:tRNA (guanosine-2'-O-)-methyltransferase
VNPDRFALLTDVLSRRQPDLTVLMERVHKPHNLSAILRNCDAVGVLEAHAVPARGAGVRGHPQVSAGTSKWVPLRTHDDVETAAATLRSRGFHLIAAHPDPAAVDYRSVDMTRPTCILLGAELRGVSDRALELADERVLLPMRGMVRSLNVSVAAALLLYEAERQRTAAGMYDAPRLPEPAFSRLLFEWAHPKLARACRDQGVAYPELTETGELASRPGDG